MLPASVASAIRAVLMDLDGTLYHQRPLRWRMLLELGLAPLTSGPRKTTRTLRHLRIQCSQRCNCTESTISAQQTQQHKPQHEFHLNHSTSYASLIGAEYGVH